MSGAQFHFLALYYCTSIHRHQRLTVNQNDRASPRIPDTNDNPLGHHSVKTAPTRSIVGALFAALMGGSAAYYESI